MSIAENVFDMEGDLEGADGHEGESGLEAALAASRRAEAKSAQELQLELEAVRLRLLRRSQIIDVLRSAYVRDVVMIKNELMRKSGMTDEEYAAQGGPGTGITDAIPSLDMRPVLALFSPEDAFLRIESCAGCGGHLEIVTKETKRVARLTKRISDLNEQMGESAKEAAQLRAELILTRHRVKELDERNNVNRDTLVAKLEQTQRTCEAEVLQLKEDARRSNRAWESKMDRKIDELAVIPVLHEERDMLREALGEERTSREEDLHHKDGEIATLQAKVADLKASAEADAKVLVESRNMTDEVQRRLKSEKGDHATTTGLLEEERARYERCRARLETSQEHLADLNERFNEMRAEVECSAENAEEEAGQASDALASAKMEIQRLRAVLGTSDAAAALETATLKASSLSEELHVARAEAREANDALREVREELQKARDEMEKSGGKLLVSMSSMHSDSSPQSEGGLSWAGSFVGSLKDDDFEEDGGERQGRMSSAMSMVPGSVKFEKGKWAVEKWIALVRFRKAVNAHSVEVSRLQNLLKIAQGGEERSRLTSELEEVSSRFSLEDMEAAMHKEVAALKMQAAGQPNGGGDESSAGGERRPSAAGQNNDAAWEAKLAESTKAYDDKLANLAARHNETVEGLRAQLSKQTEDIARLEEEGEEMKEGLKKLAKLEKNEKGLNAMTEELRKMEEETGLSVGLESGLEFTSMEGDLSKEDEARLIEELDNARDEIKNIKMRQAMVTHELLGTIKGAQAEVDMLKAALIDMTAQRDARMDMSTLAAMGKDMSAADAEEFKTLKAESKVQRKKAAALKVEHQETRGALLALLDQVRKSAKETSRAKVKVWNVRDLERARSIPPPPKPSVSAAGGAEAAGGRASVVHRSAAAAAPPPPDTTAGQHRPDEGAASSRGTESGKGTGALLGRAGAVEVVTVPDEDAIDGGRGGSGGGDDGGKKGGRGSAVAEEQRKQAELEKRRQERAAQMEAKKRLAEEEELELQDFQEACVVPQSEGVAWVVEKLELAQKNVKEQFKDVFLELKQALETHKKFVVRSRVEAREFTAKISGLETELERVRGLHNSVEEQLRGRSSALAQTQLDLSAEKTAGASTRRELAAAQAEARENVFFREKNAVLQKQLDLAEITSRRAKQESQKAKRELQEQGEALMELRKLAEESERREKAFVLAEKALKGEIDKLANLLGEAESAVERMEQARKTRLDALVSKGSQVNGYDEPELGLGVQGSTQTEFHCPRMTLRRTNNQGNFPTRALSAGATAGAPNLSLREGFGSGASGGGTCPRGPSGFVCPAVDGRAIAAERDLYSPGAGSAAFLEAQNSLTAYSISHSIISNSAHHLDAHSDSLKQLSFRPPAWAMAATEPSLCGGGGGGGRDAAVATGAGGREATFQSFGGNGGDQQQKHAGPGGQAKHWGLWHDGEGVDGEWDDTGGGRTSEDPAEPTGAPGDSPALAATTPPTGMARPETTPACCPNPNATIQPDSPGQGYRPQTSPTEVFVPGRQAGTDEACRSPPQRMTSRLFLQSAMDLSLVPPGLTGGCGSTGGGGGGGAAGRQRRPGVASAAAAGTSRRGLNSASYANLPPTGGSGDFGRRLAGPRPRPSTSSAVLTSNRSGGGGENHFTKERPAADADGQVSAWGAPHAAGHEVIDLGVLSDAIPRPRMWGERQLAAAAAAATAAGRTRSDGVGAGAGVIRAGVTRGGVVLDARFAKVRKTLRRDVLEAAERARLPLLQA